LLLGLLVLAPVARADTTLTFEGLQNLEPILNYYNGGLGGFGSGPGPNYGITFGSDSLALISGLNGGSGNFSNPPSGDTVAFFLTGPGDIMDVPAGFTTGFSFYYSAPYYTGSVTVYDGLDGTGSALATLNLPNTPAGPCTYGSYCPMEPIGVTFSGTAESVNFSGTPDYITFDNITLGNSIPTGGSVPEPGAVVLFATLLGGIGWRFRRVRG